MYLDSRADAAMTGPFSATACGLEWRDSAVEVESNGSICLTQSAAQVRRPIYRSSAVRWRRYRTHLEPLIDALRHHGVRLTDLD